MSTLGPLVLGLLARASGLAVLMARRTELRVSGPGCRVAALVLGTLTFNAAAWFRTRYKE